MKNYIFSSFSWDKYTRLTCFFTFRGSSVKNFKQICWSRQPRREIIFYPNRIGQKLTKNQRVTHANFPCFEKKTYPSKTRCLNTNPLTQAFQELKFTFSLSQQSKQWSDCLYCKNDARFTRVHKRCCLALGIACLYYHILIYLCDPIGR